MSDHYIIIGGGIIGFTLAHRLSEMRNARVTVVERDLAGLGASQRSAGLHFPVGRSATVRQMTQFSQSHYDRVRETFPRMRPVRMRVHLDGSSSQDPLEAFIDRSAMTKLDGPGALVRSKPDRYSWDVRGAHHTDVGAYVRHLQSTVSSWVRCKEGCRVVMMHDTPHGGEVTLSDGQTLKGGHVFLAPGPWCNASAFQPWTKGLALRVKKIVAFHIDVPPEESDAAEYFIKDDAFLLPIPWERRWLFSYTCDEWDCAPDDMGAGITARHRTEAARILSRYVPAWVEKLTAGRVFCDAYSPDRTPIVRTIGQHGHIHFAGGANGSGYRLAPAIAARAEALITQTSPQLLEPVS